MKFWDLIYHYLHLRLLLDDTQLSTDQWKTTLCFQQMLLVVYCVMQRSMPIEVSLKVGQNSVSHFMSHVPKTCIALYLHF